MTKYECRICGWVYDPLIGDPEDGVPPGVSFESLPKDWGCPVCGAGKSHFKKL